MSQLERWTQCGKTGSRIPIHLLHGEQSGGCENIGAADFPRAAFAFGFERDVSWMLAAPCDRLISTPAEGLVIIHISKRIGGVPIPKGCDKPAQGNALTKWATKFTAKDRDKVRVNGVRILWLC